MKDLKSLKIEKIAMQGYGLGYFQGKTIFVPYTVPGDVVEIKYTHQKKDIAFGSVVSYTSRPSGVKDPGCEAFGPKAQCGGCDWLMADYSIQLLWKDELIHSIFDNIVPKERIQPIVASPRDTHYRNKAFYPVTSYKGRLSFGMYRGFTHDVVEHRSCKLQFEEFDAIARRVTILAQKAGIQAYQEEKHGGNLRQIGFRASSDHKEIVLILVTKSTKLPFSNLLVKSLTSEFPKLVGIVQNVNRRRTNVILGDEDKVLFGRPWLNESFMDLKFRVHYRSFLQVNPGTASLAVESIKPFLTGSRNVIDAYSGIGTIGLSLASLCRELTCIEETPEAVEDAKFNAETNNLSNVKFITGKVENVLEKLLDKKSAHDTIILDPPRSGVDEKVITAISGSALDKIIYLSCNPMTLARDVRHLQGKGFELVSLQPFDMFPQTWHIETLAYLRRKS